MWLGLSEAGVCWSAGLGSRVLFCRFVETFLLPFSSGSQDQTGALYCTQRAKPAVAASYCSTIKCLPTLPVQLSYSTDSSTEGCIILECSRIHEERLS